MSIETGALVWGMLFLSTIASGASVWFATIASGARTACWSVALGAGSSVLGEHASLSIPAGVDASMCGASVVGTPVGVAAMA